MHCEEILWSRWELTSSGGELSTNGVGELDRARRAAEIPRANARRERVAQRRHDPIGDRALIDVAKHEDSGQQQRRRGGETLAGNIRRAPVHRLEHSDFGSE